MCVSRGISSPDTEKRGIHSEDMKPHRFSKTTTDTPLFPPKPLNRISSRNRYKILQHVRRPRQPDINRWPSDPQLGKELAKMKSGTRTET